MAERVCESHPSLQRVDGGAPARVRRQLLQVLWVSLHLGVLTHVAHGDLPHRHLPQLGGRPRPRQVRWGIGAVGELTSLEGEG